MSIRWGGAPLQVNLGDRGSRSPPNPRIPSQSPTVVVQGQKDIGMGRRLGGVPAPWGVFSLLLKARRGEARGEKAASREEEMEQGREAGKERSKGRGLEPRERSSPRKGVMSGEGAADARGSLPKTPAPRLRRRVEEVGGGGECREREGGHAVPGLQTQLRPCPRAEALPPGRGRASKLKRGKVCQLPLGLSQQIKPHPGFTGSSPGTLM